jgi:hypothetical protein
MNPNLRMALRVVVFVILAVVLYQRMRPTNPPAKDLNLIFSGASSTVFSISPDGPNRWNATYSNTGHTAKFIVAFDSPLEAPDSLGVSFGKGHFIAVSGSDATSLLPALKDVLQAKSPIAAPKRVADLPFTFASLGSHQSRNDDGSFQSKPSGDWVVTKVFLPDGENDGEVFLNLNPATGQAEFSIKDPDYGDTVLRQLSSVL